MNAQRIVIELSSFPQVLDGQKVIGMKFGDEDYVLLLVKSNPIIHSMVTRDVAENFGVRPIAGMAFDYRASLAQSQLVTHPDPKVTGLYVKVADFPKVSVLFDK